MVGEVTSAGPEGAKDSRRFSSIFIPPCKLSLNPAANKKPAQLAPKRVRIPVDRFSKYLSGALQAELKSALSQHQ